MARNPVESVKCGHAILPGADLGRGRFRAIVDGPIHEGLKQVFAGAPLFEGRHASVVSSFLIVRLGPLGFTVWVRAKSWRRFRGAFSGRVPARNSAKPFESL